MRWRTEGQFTLRDQGSTMCDLRHITLRFSNRESRGLFNDECVELDDDSHLDLVKRLRKELPLPSDDGFIRPMRTSAFMDLEFLDTGYGGDCQKADQILSSTRWKALDLQASANLAAYRGCVAQREHRYLIPLFLEIMLRSDRHVFPFEIMIRFLDLREASLDDLGDLYGEPKHRGLIFECLSAICSKMDYSSAQKLAGRIAKQWCQ